MYMYMLLSIGILFNTSLHSKAIESGCEDCGCCKDRICETGSADGRNDVQEYCTNGCKPGYGGNKCYNKCPDGCLTCEHNKPKNCVTCADGKYFVNKSHDNKICKDCPVNCKQCTSKTKCQKCNQPYFNDDKISNCSLSCSRNCICDRIGVCSSCKEGYFNVSNTCLDACTNTCAKCTDKSHCQSCRPSYTGDMCCVKDGYCQKCASSTVCDRCVYGYYGETCKKTCPGACQNTSMETQCERENGICVSCGVGLYGDYCSMNCSEKCQSNRCHKDTGHCTIGCIDGYRGQSCTETLILEDTSSSAAVAVGGVVSVVVIIGIVVVIIIVVRRRRSRPGRHENLKEDNEQDVPKLPAPSMKREKTQKSTATPMNDELEEDVENADQDLVQNVTERQDLVYENIPGVNVSRLDAYVRTKTKEMLEQEFRRLPRGLVHSYDDSQKPENAVMNRYNGLYPYDHSRVKINRYPDFFINACYIDGFQNRNCYIASLGPFAKATRQYYTFWKMVWYKKADIIVMLTNLIEPSGIKCEKYWPDLNCSNVHQDITVLCRSIQVFTEYTFRIFTIEKRSEQRVVYQLHYTAWPDKSIPDEVTSLVEFRQRVRSVSRVQQGPIIVHCSAGIGRTGTYIALDRLTETGEAGERINVCDCVYQMRQQRVNMVQTLEQYEFLHKALVHTLTFGGAAIRAEEFGEYIRKTSDAEFKKNFNLLEKVIDEQSPEEIQARARNGRQKDKNRKNSDIPGDKHRPMLHICRSYNSPNYINAMYVNGFMKKNQYIIAQSPLPETVVDFLCLVYQECSYCIVSMEDAELFGKGIGAYLGADNHELKHGSFVVKASRRESKQNYSIQKLTITNTDKRSSGERVVYHYQLNNWKNNELVPPDAREFAQFVKDVTDKAEEINDEKAPILVHCLNGAQRSGLFCAVSLLLDKVEGEGQVSVPNVLRQLRNRRRKAIPNQEQFEFCFQCVGAYLDSSNTYSNIASFNMLG